MNDKYEPLARLMGVDDETANKMRTQWSNLQSSIEWHCPGRHGVIRDVPAEMAGSIQRVIEWHLGHGACRWTKTTKGLTSVEFVHMTKVFPAPRRPWEWCGTTLLFTDWQDREAEGRRLSQKFAIGDRVWFLARGSRHEGLVAGVNAKTISVLVEGEGRWRVVPQDLNKKEDQS